MDRLFEDVISIVDSHMSRSNSYESQMNDETSPINKNSVSKYVFINCLHKLKSFRWQKMYEEIYLELEKVRNMLVTQYNINQKMKEEV